MLSSPFPHAQAYSHSILFYFKDSMTLHYFVQGICLQSKALLFDTPENIPPHPDKSYQRQLLPEGLQAWTSVGVSSFTSFVNLQSEF